MARVVVTGAGGFVGRALLDSYRSVGWDVAGVELSPAPDWAREWDVVAGDVSEPGTWQEHLVGADVVVHTAALVSNVVSRRRAWQVNVCGTRNVVEAVAEGGAKRMVQFSSLAVYSHHRDGVLDEHHPVRPSGDVYGDTKIAGEQVVLQAHAAGEVQATIVRPGDIYGPGSRPWTILPVQSLKSHQVVLPAMGKGVFSPIYVDDVVEFVRTAAQHPAAIGEVFNLTGGVAVSTREFISYYSRMLGMRPPPVAPTPVAVGVAAALGATLRRLGRPSEVNAATMRMLAATGTVSIDKARRLLGWEPRVPLAAGMARTEAWLRREGFLDKDAK
ncbi:MAG: NAD-dependent epimerase/dehydratase family protein [Ilumatobacteraceae bacterium]